MQLSRQVKVSGGKRETVEVFRHRLLELIARAGLSRSQFAAKAGLDRSTLSLLLGDSAVRLPRAETIAKIAAQHNSSVDWLLGLAQQDKVATEIVPQLEIETAAGSPADARLQLWREEATGFKIRYVPTTLPDLLKSDDVIDYEYANRHGPRPALRQEAAQSNLEYTRKPETDMEVCSSFQAVMSFARGEGVWNRLDRKVRLAQIERMIWLARELYPTFRWFMFDGLVKHDLKTGAEARFAFEEGVYGSETAMAPRSNVAAGAAPRVGSANEDDGYLVTITTDMNDDASYCLVFDAARVADGPICKLALPERVSSGTHCTWAPGSELRRWRQTDSAAESIGL